MDDSLFVLRKNVKVSISTRIVIQGALERVKQKKSRFNEVPFLHVLLKIHEKRMVLDTHFRFRLNFLEAAFY